MGIGKKFQDQTKYFPGKIPAGFYGRGERPAAFKTYSNSERFELPDPQIDGGPPLWEIIEARRSERSYGGEPMTKDELSQLLWAAQGITAEDYGYKLRTAPSAGALYPIETYLEIKRITDMPRGIYHYDVREGCLEAIRPGDFSREMCDAALEQDMVKEADVVFIFTAMFARSGIKYGERAYRYVYLDCAHIAQNLLLAVSALGLSACPIAALYDQKVNDILKVDGEGESILYMVSVGRGL